MFNARPAQPTAHAAAELVLEQVRALQRGEVARCLAMAAGIESPELLGPPASAFARELRGGRGMDFTPLLGCSNWELMGVLPLSEGACAVRVRVWPAYSSSAPFAAARVAPVDYTWALQWQPGSTFRAT